jgi:hypothetical protein
MQQLPSMRPLGQIRREQKRTFGIVACPFKQAHPYRLTISDLDEQTRRHCQALPNIIQLIPCLCERVAFDPDSPQGSHAEIAV